MKSYISKTNMLRAIQCQLAFYYDMIEEPISNMGNTNFLFDQGNEVERYAKMLFPDGIECSTGDGNIEKNISKTDKALLNTNETFINPAFMVEISGIKFYAQTDLIDESERGWELIEVKSSTKVKWQYIYDIAFQFKILHYKFPGIKIYPFIMHLNKEYRRDQMLDIEKLFVRFDASSEVMKNQSLLDRNLYWMKKILRTQKKPVVQPGIQCFHPHKCKYTEKCLSGQNIHSLFFKALKRNRKSYPILNFGVEELNSLSRQFRFKKYDWTGIDNSIHRNEKIDKKSLINFLEAIKTPTKYYTDFGLTSFATPLYTDTVPYERFIYQFIIKKQINNGESVKCFISDPKRDARKWILIKFIEETNEPGDIITYNAHVLKSVFTAFKSIFPDLSKDLDNRINRFKDLMLPFIEDFIYEPKLNYKYTLKNIGEVLFDNLHNLSQIKTLTEAGWIFQHLDKKKPIGIIEGKNSINDFFQYRLDVICELHNYLKRKAGVFM